VPSRCLTPLFERSSENASDGCLVSGQFRLVPKGAAGFDAVLALVDFDDVEPLRTGHFELYAALKKRAPALQTFLIFFSDVLRHCARAGAASALTEGTLRGIVAHLNCPGTTAKSRPEGVWVHTRRSARRAASARETGVHDSLLVAINMLDLGILIIDRDDRIALANRAAEALLRLRKRPHIGGDAMEQRQMPARLDRQIRSVIGPGRSRIEGDIATTNFGGRLLFFQAVRCGVASDATDILFVSESPKDRLQNLSPIASCYGLTRAETQLLQAVVNGETLSTYAKRAGITLNTVKGYLKQLFRKTSTSRQSDLLRLVLANPILHLVSTERQTGAGATSGRAEASWPKPA